MVDSVIFFELSSRGLAHTLSFVRVVPQMENGPPHTFYVIGFHQ
jgi:hypothetical protein